MINVRSNWPMLSGIDPEISLQGKIDRHPGRHVNERTAGPDGRIQGGKFIVFRGESRSQSTHATDPECSRTAVSVSVKMTPFYRPRSSSQRTIDHLALELSLHAGQEFPLGFRNPQFFKRVFDFRWHIVHERLDGRWA